MNFSLFFRGQLRSNGGPKAKHDLRKLFHLQLQQLWCQPPLEAFADFYKLPRDQFDDSIAIDVGTFNFVPLICQAFHTVARLDITLLRPEPPGSLITTGGDIDNRLKTLLDALKIPTEPDALPPGAAPDPGETPFFCLVQDDNLITEISVRTKQLLEPNVPRGEVVVLLDVSMIKTDSILGGMELP